MSTDILANIPSPPQGAWQIGPITLRAYALCILVGIVVALFISVRRYRDRGGDPDVVWDAAIIVIPAGIIGGRLYHVITDHEKYFGPGKNPVDALKIWEGGLGIWGAVALGVIAVVVYLRIKGIKVAPFLDAAAPAVILAQAIGRLGNWFNQELYGRPTDVPWALEIYERVDEAGNLAPMTGTSTGEVLATVHPTFLYELIWNLLIFAVLIWADRRFKLGHGRVFALYVAGYTFGRFFIELMRDDAATMILGQRVNTWVSLIVFITALIAFFRLPKGRETPADVFAGSKRAQREADSGEDDSAGSQASAASSDGDHQGPSAS